MNFECLSKKRMFLDFFSPFISKARSNPDQRRLDPGKETLERFFQVGNQKEYQNVVIISFVHLEKINIFCFMYNGVAEKLSLPCPLEN